MNKHEFLSVLSSYLKGFSADELNRVLNYYDELISDKIEAGENEYRVVHNLGDIRMISRQIQAELAGERLSSMHSAQRTAHNEGLIKNSEFRIQNEGLFNNNNSATNHQPPITNHQSNPAPCNLQAAPSKKGSTIAMVARLFSAPILIPVGIVFFVLFISAVFAVGGTILGLAVSSFACLLAVIPGAVLSATEGTPWALFTAGGLLIATGVLGILAIISYKLGKIFLKYLLKGAVASAKAFYGKKNKAVNSPNPQI
ncbi:MAG: DUF1700 domain-containing protein [Firmicutes bacterium]|nr:DUF1700 domain-containing protein [Bacillota bacterium]